MATVVKLMLADPSADIVTSSIATYVDSTRLRKLVVGVTGVLRASWAVGRGRADVLHVHLAHGGSVLRKSVPMAVARRVGVTVIVHAHSYDFAGWFDRLPGPARAFVRSALAADRWLVLGTELAVEYADRVGLDPESVTVLYNPVRLPEAVAPQEDTNVIRIVTLGRLGQRKGSFDLIDAVASLPVEIRRRMSVTMCGDGDVDEVRESVRRNGIDDVVTVRGWTSPEDCAEILSRSHVFVLPSYSEGLPMALLEAMSHGLAPVTTPAGSIGEVVTDDVDALVVTPGDVPALATSLRRVVEDGDARRRIAAAARATASRFDVDTWYASLNGIWRDARGVGK
ncbi:Glycosyltransferase involved in cell wall bisynthesis [Rhodococcoides kyotonense]|uniref:Glycosyltransferase involved in cell wall bisynthesis n=2 Tax=Rhodococcoides kyotonense TaxID=398843 RepID=A0A239LKJ0_9NOCA|nr:Glycosyltransferase involved in cell wall bisynthesis [Rhodococcus kyotonensis]